MIEDDVFTIEDEIISLKSEINAEIKSLIATTQNGHKLVCGEFSETVLKDWKNNTRLLCRIKILAFDWIENNNNIIINKGLLLDYNLL